MAVKARRWLRFSIRTLLIVTTLIALPLGRMSYLARRRQAAFDAIQGAGGQINRDPTAKSLSAWNRQWRSIWGEAYASNVWAVYLKKLSVGDEIMPHLAALPELRVLDLGQTQITDEGLRHLQGLHELRDLVVVETVITDAGVKHICQLHKLRHLNLGGTKITDAAAFDLVKLPEIRELMLTVGSITDTSIERLKPLTELTSLYLNGSQVTDAGVAQLKSFFMVARLGSRCRRKRRAR